ncbi:acid-sensing ion channel 1C [Caerostris darwini]|uniref:Acid-sensing ion channel 1C n=1 Tax=Caerostris darwini TaxID=1538125 RepID=A0AAV4R446_9ARAC|nr:acid-sensing ion channel 1C [Caerostris darwini]
MVVYFTYPVVVNLQVEQEKRMEFPAVTVCNLNRMKLKYEMCLLENPKSRDCVVLTQPNSGSLVLSERRNYLSCTSQLNGTKMKEAVTRVSFLEKYSQLRVEKKKRFGHFKRELVEHCSFNGKISDVFEFKDILNPRYGNCFTNKFTNLVTTTRSEGSTGLEMILNVEPDDYLPISHTVGARIVIHSPSDNPNPEDNGINIIPGYETIIYLRQTVMRRLPAPYKDRCVSYQNNQDRLMKSQTLCMQACIQQYNYKECGCVEPSLPAKLSMKRCNATNTSEICCLDDVMNQLAIHGTDCECPLSCNSTYYNEKRTMTIWPSNVSFFSRKSSLNKTSLKVIEPPMQKLKYFSQI